MINLMKCILMSINYKLLKEKEYILILETFFKICPRENIECYGIVVNNHVNNKNGDDFIVIFVFKSDVDIEQSVKKGIRKEDLLIDPEIVGKEYWTRGYFFNVGHIESKVNNYGFYSIGKRKFF